MVGEVKAIEEVGTRLASALANSLVSTGTHVSTCVNVIEKLNNMIDCDTLVCVLSEYTIKSHYCHTLKGINEWTKSPSLPTK